MSVYMRYVPFSLLKACHLHGIPYSTLAELHGKVIVSLDDILKDRLISSQEFSEYIISNTYSALNNLVLRKDSNDSKTCKVKNLRSKCATDSTNPTDKALSKRDADFILPIGKGTQLPRSNPADFHGLKLNRDSSVDIGLGLFLRQDHTLKGWSAPPALLQQSVIAEVATLQSTGGKVKAEVATLQSTEGTVKAEAATLQSTGVKVKAEVTTLESTGDNVLEKEGKSIDGDDKKERTGPNQEQLDIVKEYYIRVTPKVVKEGENFAAGLHHREMVFENYFYKKPRITRGFVRYNIEIHKFRAYASLRYTHCGFQVRSITTHIDESCVKLHWRLYYQPQWKILKFWTFSFSAPAEEKFDWVEGISTFYVNRDGKVTKHRIDRTVPFPVKEKKNKAKVIAAVLGMAPTTKFWDLFKKKGPPNQPV